MADVHCGRMTSDQSTTDQQVWGEPDYASPRWGVRETITAIGVAVVIAAFGGAAIYAATGNTHSAASVFGRGAPGGPPPAGGSGDPRAATPANLHGEFVVANGAGGYTTRLTQSGTVTDVSATGITVRSPDNFTQTYVLPPGAGTGHSIARDDEVTLQATRTGQTVTVNTISDRPS